MTPRPVRARARAVLAAVVLTLPMALVPAAGAQVVRAFSPRYSANLRGDITLIGNTLMTCPAGGQCARGQDGNGNRTNNNDWSMDWVDIDNVGSTFNSSEATLTLPPGTTVLWAGLYWGGDSNSNARNLALLATPGSGYATVTAGNVDANGSVYGAFADVTARVQAAGSGVYRVANVQSTTGTNRFAGWSLVVAYGDPGVSPRNLVVNDGFAQVAPNTSVIVTMGGFLTPPAGAVQTRIGVVTLEGDEGYSGDAFQLNGNYLQDALNPQNNFFNSSVGRFGVNVADRNPAYVNQFGFDADLLNANGILPNGATSATLRLWTQDDRYYPIVVTFATDLYQPILEGNSFTKSVTDLDGPPTRPGDTLEYTIVMRNTGQDAAVQTVWADTLPANAAYVPGSLVVVNGPNAGTKTDAAGDDQGEYDAAGRRVVVRLGAGADAAQGGTIAVGVQTTVRFRARVGVPAPNGSVVSNQAVLDFRGAQLGTAFHTASDADTTVAGFQPATVTVTAPVMAGTVFEDAGYGGGAGRPLAGAGGVGRPGVRVELYDGAGALRAATSTDGAGAWAFDGWSPGAWDVRVVNGTVTSARPGGSAAGLLPVQTYRTDATGGTAVAVTDRVGGEDPARVDAAANGGAQALAGLATASTVTQSVTRVTLGTTSVTGIDFGFNFSTVVSTRDAGQGSLRQFLANAAALGNAGLAQVGQAAGVEAAIFMVPDGQAHPGLRPGLASQLTGGVARITVLSPLPAITDAATRIDGATQRADVGNTNPATLGAGGATGPAGPSLPALDAPEVEIADGAGLALGLDLQAAGAVLARLAVHGFGNAPNTAGQADVRVGAGATGALLDECVLGTTATAFRDPGAAGRSGGDALRVEGAAGGTLRNSRVGHVAGNGVALAAGAVGWQVTGSEIRSNGRSGVWAAGSGHVLDGDALRDNGDAGVLVAATASGITITRNAVSGNGTAGGQAGIDLLAAGDDPARGTAPFVTRNDAGDGDSGGNALLNFPVLEGAAIGGGTLSIAGWARPGSSIELFLAAPDPSGFGEGAVYLARLVEGSAADLDAGASSYAPPVNGLDQGTDATNRFRFVLPVPAGVTSGSRLTATATLAGVGTSEFSGVIALGGGVTVAGTVYADADHDGVRDPGEAGPGVGVTLWAKLAAEPPVAPALQVQPVDGASGSFAFGFVGAGTYAIVLDDNASAGDVTPSAPAGWLPVEAAPGVRRNVAVAGLDVAGQDFGLWHGSTVAGTVFRDDGAAGAPGAVANDGAAQAGEAGLAGVPVTLLASPCPGGACDSTLTDGAGGYRLWLPDAAVGAAASVRETDPAAWRSTGGGAGTTGGTYDRTADAAAFVPAGGVAYAGVDFGDVPPNAFVPAGAAAVAAGAAAQYAHRFTAGSAGQVTFGATQAPSPAIPGWSVQLYRDLDCDGVLDPGEPAVAGPVDLVAGQSVCLIARHASPAGAPAGAQEQLALSATFAYAGATPPLSADDGLSDLTTVSASGGGLSIVKSVDRATAAPGDTLTYTITYTNLSAAPLTAIEIRDATPSWTVFTDAGCVALGAGLSACAVRAAPAPGGTGAVVWTLGGSLAPGASGAVAYRVRVE